MPSINLGFPMGLGEQSFSIFTVSCAVRKGMNKKQDICNFVSLQIQPRRALNFQCPLLGERFAELCGPQMRTQVYDLNTCRIFNEEPPSYREVVEEVCQVSFTFITER